ncbi:glycosyltransferase family 2 protein [Azotobacter armeniacus]
MKVFVVIATKGRAKETYILLDYITRQTLTPAHVVVVGSEPRDIDGMDMHPLVSEGHATLLLSKAGLTIQRNAGLDALIPHVQSLVSNDWLVAFFDDDFRPAPNWLENTAKAMEERKEIVGITGHVLADGVKSEFGIPEEDAQQYLSGAKPAESHWSNSAETRILEGLYGCNMAFRGTVVDHSRFDEKLPLYGWQEDYDFANQARKYGVLAFLPTCKGVHLGVSSGRTSGVRFGYSQIANPIYLAKKGTMSWRKAGTLMSKNILSNLAKTIFGVKIKDFPGRLRGNLRAFAHLFLGKLDPLRVLDI